MVSATVLVLLLVTVLLAAGSLSMLGVRLAGSGLRGTGSFSGALAVGSLAAASRLLHGTLWSWYLADVALLMAFFLLRVALQPLNPGRALSSWQVPVLAGTQLLIDLSCQAGVLPTRVRLISLGTLLAWQTAAAALSLRSQARGPLRAPGLLLASLLWGITGLTLLRSGWLLLHLSVPKSSEMLDLLACCLFLAVSLGLAFGFFWITTTRRNAEVEHCASTDPLTRVFNRRHFLKWCEKELLRSQRSGLPFSVLMIDLDHFKSINDNFGHHRGDEVLCAAVERMQDSVRGIDVLCRWGGEEFAVLLPNAPAESTHVVAERIRVGISRMNIQLAPALAEPSQGAQLTASIGAATYRDLDDDVAAMLLRADRALYRAKETGRNRVLLGT